MKEQRAFSLGNQFLIASPYMGDPRFHGTVIYLCEHNEQGALGLVVNMPTDMALGEILTQLDLGGEERTEPVYYGGPVQTERGFVLHTPDGQWQNSLAISADVSMTTSRDVLEAIASDVGPQQFLMALGYAGWGAGQLEAELSGNAWLVCPASADILFQTPAVDRYQRVLDRLGVSLAQLSGPVGHA